MSEATQAVRAAGGPSLRLRVAAVAVVIALAGLAAYTLFSGPTKVSVPGPAKAAPARTAPAEGEQEREGARGD